MVMAISLSIEVAVYCVFLNLSIRELIKTYRNPYPVFNEHEEKRIGIIIKEYKDKGMDIKTRSIEIGR